MGDETRTKAAPLQALGDLARLRSYPLFEDDDEDENAGPRLARAKRNHSKTGGALLFQCIK